jgi:Lon protease-like protein
MTHCSSETALQQFSGSAPLFPLPNVVLFPNAVLPLHIFEPRYRQMTADALSGERLVAMCLTTAEANLSQSAPPIHPMVGLGRIIAHELLDDGRYVLVLRGIARARLIQEVPRDRLYRVGELQIISDATLEKSQFDRRSQAEEIVSLFCKLFPGTEYQRAVQQAMSEDLPLGSICDVIAASLPIDAQVAQLLLDELNADIRGQMLWQLLKSMDSQNPATNRTSGRFPPEFSSN